MSSGCYIIAYSGSYWYGVFKNFTTTAEYRSFVVAAVTNTNTFFSAQYQVENSCETLTKVSVCYPYNYNAEDTNEIYIGEPDSSQIVEGNSDVFYHHQFWTRQGEIIETQNKISFTANFKKNFASTLNKLFEFRPEPVPGWYKDYLLSVYFRGDILINDTHTLVTDLNFEDIDVDYWVAYAVLTKQVKGSFGCAPYACPNDCVCVPVAIQSIAVPGAIQDQAWAFSIPFTGTSTVDIVNITKPDWITTPHIVGSNVVLSGTPGIDDILAPNTVSFTLVNPCGTVDYSHNISVEIPPPPPDNDRDITYDTTYYPGNRLTSEWLLASDNSPVHSGGILAGDPSPYTVSNVLTDFVEYKVRIQGTPGRQQAWIDWTPSNIKVLLNPTTGLSSWVIISILGNVTIHY
jgi:hypothetical protein